MIELKLHDPSDPSNQPLKPDDLDSLNPPDLLPPTLHDKIVLAICSEGTVGQRADIILKLMQEEFYSNMQGFFDKEIF